ncbi:hypothetical protein RIVM261_075490 [Rivularia sp. IAM M-261]|nr:hypothetical protein RIVM261_075490 [Rivularia sp. IAM M-261]
MYKIEYFKQMKLVSNLLSILTLVVGLLLISQQQTFALNTSTKSTSSVRVQPIAIDDWKIRDIAKLSIVRVFSPENTATGIVIDKKQDSTGEYIYLVVTNNHVVANQKPDFRIETPDGKVYQASVYPKSKVNSNGSADNIDLELLYFSSSIAYEKAILGNSSSIKNEDDVFVAGFACKVHSCEKETEFIFKPGTALLLDKPLVSGYQLGFTSETKIGTSGGAVLNKKGELIAINGRGKYPIQNGQYTYIDGSQPSVDFQKIMRHFAWGIPINTYKNWASKISLDNVSTSAKRINQSVTSSLQTSDSSYLLSYEQKFLISIVILIIFLTIILFIPIVMVFKKNKSVNNQELSLSYQKQQEASLFHLNKNSNNLWLKLIRRNKSKLEVELIEIKAMLQDILHTNNETQKRFVQIEFDINELKRENNLSWNYTNNEIKTIQNQNNQNSIKIVKIEKYIQELKDENSRSNYSNNEIKSTLKAIMSDNNKNQKILIYIEQYLQKIQCK